MLKKILIAIIALVTVLSLAQSAFAYDVQGYYEAYRKKISQAYKIPNRNPATDNKEADADKAPAAQKKQTYTSVNNLLRQRIPAIMYHKITDNPAEVTDYVITGEMLRADFQLMKARGYTPIFVSEYFAIKELANVAVVPDVERQIIEFFEKNPKPIIITFDDGYEGIYTHALPLMQEFGFKANFYVCGRLIDVNNPEYCTWEEVKLLAESGLAEIGNHTYSLHAKSKEQLKDFYDYQVDAALEDYNLNRNLIAENTGVYSNIISFPYGLYTNNLYNKLSDAGYNGFISTDYRVNFLSDKQDALGRFNRPASYSTRDFFELVENY